MTERGLPSKADWERAAGKLADLALSLPKEVSLVDGLCQRKTTKGLRIMLEKGVKGDLRAAAERELARREAEPEMSPQETDRA